MVKEVFCELQFGFIRALGKVAIFVGLVVGANMSRELGIAWLVLSIAATLVGVYKDPAYPPRCKRFMYVLSDYCTSFAFQFITLLIFGSLG